MSRKYHLSNQPPPQSSFLRRTHWPGAMSSPHLIIPNLKVTPKRSIMPHKTESRLEIEIKTCPDVAVARIIFPSRSGIAFSAQVRLKDNPPHLSADLNEVSGGTLRSIISFVVLHRRTQSMKFPPQSNDSRRSRAVGQIGDLHARMGNIEQLLHKLAGALGSAA